MWGNHAGDSDYLEEKLMLFSNLLRVEHTGVAHINIGLIV